jgi:hypothetical protein
MPRDHGCGRHHHQAGDYDKIRAAYPDADAQHEDTSQVMTRGIRHRQKQWRPTMVIRRG